jgi:UTP--glucose-1-phosphate uridylyltransferase
MLADLTKAVIPAAGLGTRLLPATRCQPKEMLPVGRQPAIQFIVDELVAAGLRHLLVISGRTKRAIEDHFDSGTGSRSARADQRREAPGNDDVAFFYVRQSRPRGLADAVSLARSFVGRDSFVVALGDSIIRPGRGEPLLARMARCHRETSAVATLAVESVPPDEVGRYGILDPASDRGDYYLAADLIEKPFPEYAPSNLAVAGRYLFEPAVFDALGRVVPGVGGELQLTDGLRLLLREGATVCCVPLTEDERRYDIGNFASYFRAFFDFSLADPEFGPQLLAHVRRTLAAHEPISTEVLP